MVQTPLRPDAFSDNRVYMARQTLLSEKAKKRRGPAPTGVGTLIGVRLLPSNLSALDAWIAIQCEPRPTRPEAIRRLVGKGLATEGAPQSDASLDRQIAEQKSAIAEIPKYSEPSPEAGMAAMDKAMAEDELIGMKNKRTRRKIDRRK